MIFIRTKIEQKPISTENLPMRWLQTNICLPLVTH